jgi:hypothetical protein
VEPYHLSLICFSPSTVLIDPIPYIAIMKRRALTVHILASLFAWLSTTNFHTLAFAYQRRSFLDIASKRQLASRVGLQTRGGSSANGRVQIQDTGESAKPLLLAPIFALGKHYSTSLENFPILTKSITAGCIFAFSDYLAQTMEKKDRNSIDWRRLATSAAVGLCCFGPAAHFWYAMVFRVFPATGLVSTLQKASLGQLFFGPSFTCVFFAASLLQTGQFSLSSWLRKIRTDLPGTWVSGLGFWPLVDLVSYSLVPVSYIPLFVNVCSLIWTIYLSSVSNRAARAD